MVGNTDRMMTINREWEIIERIKLVALGISKSFLHGEVTYASAATGLQVFLQRLKALRNFFEQKWIIPKFFLPLAEINGWVKRSPAEIQHRFRIKRSQKELLQEGGYIIPKIVWEKSLDPAVDQALVTAMQALENMGVRFSKTTKMATIGMSFEEETKKIAKEEEFEKQFLPKIPNKEDKDKGGGGGGGVGGMPGGGEPPPDMSEGGEEGGEPPPPPGGGGEPTPPGGAEGGPPAPPGAALKTHAGGDEKPEKNAPKDHQEIEENEPDYADSDILKSKIWQDDRFGNWEAEEVEPLVDMLQTGHKTDSPFWYKLQEDELFIKAINSGDPDQVWEIITAYLVKQGYPDPDIEELSEILVAEGLMTHTAIGELTDMERDVERDMAQESDGLLVGASVDSQPAKKNLNGDITELMMKARKRNAKLAQPKKRKNK
jgi:hypothetical protein